MHTQIFIQGFRNIFLVDFKAIIKGHPRLHNQYKSNIAVVKHLFLISWFQMIL